MMTWKSLVLRSLVLLLPVMGSACSEEGDGEKRAPSTLAVGSNVLIITVDTLRADHVSCYNSRNVDTPAMDHLAARGALFTNATAPVPLTLPSHASLFTGQYPPAHGVRDNAGFPLPDGALTLAEVLQGKGWRTGGFVSAYVLNQVFGIAQGFSHYSDESGFEGSEIATPDSVQRPGALTVAESLAWIEENREGPFFAWVHLFEPHMPYDPPEPYASKYAKSPYAGDVAQADMLVGRLMEGVDKLGLTDKTVVVLVGDHGEGLGDHKERFHGLFVYDSTIQVPFIMQVPGLEPRRIDSQVRLIDVMPTVLDLLGMEAPDGLGGESLVPLLTGERGDLKLAAYSESYFPTLHYRWSELKTLRAGNYKYIQAPTPELYDLAADPGEEKNLASSQPEVAARMKKNLEEIEKRAGAGSASRVEPGEVDAEAAEALRLLGYTGTLSAPGVGSDSGSLPDPKDKADLVNEAARGERLIAAGQYMEALGVLRAVVKEEPHMLDARLGLGMTLFRLERFQEAAQVYMETVELAPDLLSAWANLGMAFKAQGDHEKSIPPFQQVMKLNPDNLEIKGYLIDSLLQTGRIKPCVKHCTEYLKADPDSVQVRLSFATAMLNYGQEDRALLEVKKVIAREPHLANAQYLMGKILRRQKEFGAAAAAFENELLYHVDSLYAYHELSSTYLILKNVKKAMQALERATRTFPDDFKTHLLLAQLCVQAKRADEVSLGAAQRAVELNPGSRPAKMALEQLRGMKK